MKTMNTKTMQAALIFTLILGALVPSLEAAKSRSRFASLRTWFAHLKQGLASSAVQGHYQRRRSLTAVAAVRGAAQDSADLDTPVWKRGAQAKKAALLREQRAAFAKAVDLIIAGKLDDGAESLEAFEEKYPKSPMLPDVHEAQEKIKELRQTDE